MSPLQFWHVLQTVPHEWVEQPKILIGILGLTMTLLSALQGLLILTLCSEQGGRGSNNQMMKEVAFLLETRRNIAAHGLLQSLSVRAWHAVPVWHKIILHTNELRAFQRKPQGDGKHTHINVRT